MVEGREQSFWWQRGRTEGWGSVVLWIVSINNGYVHMDNKRCDAGHIEGRLMIIAAATQNTKLLYLTCPHSLQTIIITAKQWQPETH